MHAQWYSFLLTLKRWHCYAVTALVMLLCSGAWLLFVYLPLDRALKDVTMQLQQAQKDISVCAQERQSNKQFVQNVQTLQTDYDAHIIEQQAACKELMHGILQRAAVHHLQVLSLKKGITQKKDHHHLCMMHIQAKGRLQDIYTFFEQFKQDRLLVQCSDVTVHHEAGDLYTIQAVLKQFLPQKMVQNESPSTLEKS